MKHKSQQKRKKTRSSAAPSGDVSAASDGNKNDVEEERRDVARESEKAEKQKIDSLMEALCYILVEEAIAAYREAGGDLNKATEILSDLVDHDDDPSTVSVASGSSGQETGSTSEYGAGSSSSCGEELTRERWLKGTVHFSLALELVLT